MTEEEFANQEIELGNKVHYNQGEWWIQRSRFFCESAIPFKAIGIGSSKPKLKNSLAGYSHYTNDKPKNPRVRCMMHMAVGSEAFDIETLSSNRRSKVRRGLKRNEIVRVDNVEPYIDQLKDVVISARERTGDGKPVSYYQNNFEEWKNYILRLAPMKDRDFWLAFQEDKVAAYFHVTIVGDLCMVGAAKSHSDYLKHYPNDALVFSVLDYAINKKKCKTIVYGDWVESDAHLNKFKEGYGFEKKDMVRNFNLRLPVDGIMEMVKKGKK